MNNIEINYPVQKIGTFSDQDFREMYHYPIEIINFSGIFPINSRIKVHSFDFEMFYGGEKFQNGGDFLLQYSDSPQGKGIHFIEVLNADIFTEIVNENQFFSMVNTSFRCNPELIKNKGIYLTNSTSPFTGGNSHFSYNLWYSITAVS